MTCIRVAELRMMEGKYTRNTGQKSGLALMKQQEKRNEHLLRDPGAFFCQCGIQEL